MFNASLTMLKITGCTDKNFRQTLPGPPYVVMLNPDNIKWHREIEYNEEQAPDSSAPSQKYKRTPSDKLSFDIVIDCSGVVDNKRTSMADEVSALEKIVYTYNGDKHRPNFVRVQWGKNMMFKGLLDTFETSYTLFRPDGSPLRAKVSLSFSQYVAPQTVAQKDQKKSPDVSHLITVVEGLNLPQLCYQVWEKETYYVQVARFNNLNKFRNLKGGERLIFPPIIQP
jgi:hypothetical protein